MRRLTNLYFFFLLIFSPFLVQGQQSAVSAGGDARAGTIIGKALENYDSDHIGTIEVAVGRA